MLPFLIVLLLILFFLFLVLFSLWIFSNWFLLPPDIRQIPYVEKPTCMPWWKFLLLGHGPRAYNIEFIVKQYKDELQNCPPMCKNVVGGWNMLVVHWIKNYYYLYPPSHHKDQTRVVLSADLQKYVNRNSIPCELISCFKEKSLIEEEGRFKNGVQVGRGKMAAAVGHPDSSAVPAPTPPPESNSEFSSVAVSTTQSTPSSLASTSVSGLDGDSYPANLIKQSSSRKGFIRYRFYFGRVRVVPVSYDGIQQILLKDDDGFCKPELVRRALASRLGKKSILWVDKEPHDRLRTIIQPAFHYLKLRSLAPLFVKNAKRLSEEWAKMWRMQHGQIDSSRGNNNTTETIATATATAAATTASDLSRSISGPSFITPNLEQDMMLLTTKVIGEAAMGFNCDDPRDMQLLRDYMVADQFNIRFPAFLARILLPTSIAMMFRDNKIEKQHIVRVWEGVAQLIQRRRDLREKESRYSGINSGDETSSSGAQRTPDLLDYMFESQNGKPEVHTASSTERKSALQLSSEELLHQAMTFMYAGQLTTASTVSFLLSELANQPHLQDKLRDEVCEVFELDQDKNLVIKAQSRYEGKLCGSTDQNYGERIMDEMDRLPFLDALLKETLRLYPAVAFSIRTAVTDQVIDGQSLPAKVILQIPVYAMHRQSEFWGSTAGTFDPSRYLVDESATGYDKKESIWRNSTALLVFSLGNRGCIGRKFSLYEAKCVIGRLIIEWKFMLPSKEEFLRPKPSNTDHASPFLLRPRGLRLDVAPVIPGGIDRNITTQCQ